MPVALIDKQIHKLLEREVITGVNEVSFKDCVEPASIDLPVGAVAYAVKEKVLPYQKKVEEVLRNIMIEKINLKGGALLYKGQTYLIPVAKLNLPEHHSGIISPKSSSGRIDLMLRSLFDNCGLYDTVPGGGKGVLWLELTPQSFNIRIKAGERVSQLRLFRDDLRTDIDLSSEKLLFDEKSNVLENEFHQGDLVLKLNCKKESLVGYEAIATNEPIDMSSRGKLFVERYFKPVYSDKDGKVTLEAGKFYIFATKEKVSVPTPWCAEMLPFSHLVGELRAHYAGFFDPGFGYGKKGEIKGAKGVLEIRPHETISVFDGQPICLMRFFRNIEVPTVAYGHAGSNYQGQGLKLAKFFRQR